MKITADFVILLTAVSFSGLVCAALATWYVWPALARRPRTDALVLILWPHTCRFLNLAAATASQAGRAVPHDWRIEVAWGDFIAAALALAAIFALRRKSPLGFTLAWVSTLFGMADFFNSFGQGIYLDVANTPLGAVWYIAIGAVPPLFTCHVLALRLLRRS